MGYAGPASGAFTTALVAAAVAAHMGANAWI